MLQVEKIGLVNEITYIYTAFFFLPAPNFWMNPKRIAMTAAIKKIKVEKICVTAFFLKKKMSKGC